MLRSHAAAFLDQMTQRRGEPAIPGGANLPRAWEKRQRETKQPVTYDEIERKGPRKRKIEYWEDITEKRLRGAHAKNSIECGAATVARIVRGRYRRQDVELRTDRSERRWWEESGW